MSAFTTAGPVITVDCSDLLDRSELVKAWREALAWGRTLRQLKRAFFEGRAEYPYAFESAYWRKCVEFERRAHVCKLYGREVTL